ncbi:alpha-L-fucosidase [Flavobacteriaceae bacterium]|mgnify:FL=1|jgi:alpha-L-fucosidase|nr:alpha-L-fucosidase [Flavobacteriaceae bacterium]|tara:strand:- start:188 stop:1525 length:1338 start_codon:yes stop_codon:yes gene_type:complete
MRIKILLAILILLPSSVCSQQVNSNNIEDKMKWFEEAKLGIFIHWGIYSVNGISESWSFYNGYISHTDYMKQLDGFNAKNYDPKEWANLIAESGAKYTVITSKHHDGFALWDSKYGKLNSLESSKSKKDLLTPFVKEIRGKGLKLGLYYSLPDWSYKDYTNHTNKIKRYSIQDKPERWQKFLNYRDNQLMELKSRYKPDLWWFDGDWEHNAIEWKSEMLKTKLQKNFPNVIVNSRLNEFGDYETPEIGIPVYRPSSKYWELCMTINDSWGYQQNDNNYKTPLQVIDLFVDTLSKGGNLLLNISPKPNGKIPEKQKLILKELGKWSKKHDSAIYSTKKGIPYDHFYGPSTLSKDKKTLFLFLRDIPKDNQIVVKGISNKINRAYIVGNGTVLNQQLLCKVYWNKYPGLTYIEIPKETIDPYYTVIALVLDSPIKLFNKNTGAVEKN